VADVPGKGVSAVSIRDKIKAAADLSDEVVEVPEWDVKIRLRSPNGRERARLVGLFIDAETGEQRAFDPAVMYPALLAATCFDPETGEQLFNSDDADWLLEKNGSVIERLAMAAMKVSGLDGEAVERAKGNS